MKAQEIRTVREHLIADWDPRLVANVLYAASGRGDLVSAGPLHQLPDGRVAVKARLLDRPPAAPGRRWGKPAAVAGAVAVALGLLAAAVWWVLAHLATVLTVLAVAAALYVSVARTGAACRGPQHCPGCGH
ncbi:MAG TPA: hypothetical protein VF755_09470 [Catenuloplanes sp.]